MKYNITLITCPNVKSAGKISDVLLKKKLAACINIMNVKSKYLWKGKIEKSNEVLMIIKTQSSLLKRLEKEVRKIHPYNVPEIISFKINHGNMEYLKWISEVTK